MLQYPTITPKPGPHRARLLRRLAVTSIAAMLAATVTTRPGSAAEEAGERAVDPAVEAYASAYSLSHEEAKRRLDRIQPIQEILASIRASEHARVAGWNIDHDGSLVGWVWLTGDDAPSASAARIANAHDDIEIRTGARHSYAALLAAQNGLSFGAVGRADDGPVGADGIGEMVTFTGIDMNANAVRIGIDPELAAQVPGLDDDTPAATTDEALAIRTAQVTRLLEDRIGVAYAVVDGRGHSDSAWFAGGQEMRRVSSDTRACTSGFAARKRGNGPYGIITAGHCPDSLKVHGITLEYARGYASLHSDAQFHRIPTGAGHTALDDFECGDIRLCDVDSDIKRSRMMGDWVCHYGMNSGRSCGTVAAINHRPAYAGACTYEDGRARRCDNVFVLVRGDDLKGCRGDSGGPWYRSGTAYGIHKGNTNPDDCTGTGKEAWFSAIQLVEGLLTVDILTQSAEVQ